MSADRTPGLGRGNEGDVYQIKNGVGQFAPNLGGADIGKLFLAYSTGNQNLPGNGSTPIQFDTVDSTTDAPFIISGGTNGDTITITRLGRYSLISVISLTPIIPGFPSSILLFTATTNAGNVAFNGVSVTIDSFASSFRAEIVDLFTVITVPATIQIQATPLAVPVTSSSSSTIGIITLS